MERIEVIFWVILAVIWLISGSLIRRRSRKERERLKGEEEVYGKPEEKTAGPAAGEEVSEVFEVLEGEEEAVPVSEQPPIILPSTEEEIIEPIEVKEVPKIELVAPTILPMIPEIEELEMELTDLETVRRGIIVSEILGPPRARKPFRRIR